MELTRKIKELAVEVIERIDRDSVTVYAAQASFYVIIASIPFIMLLLSLAQYIVPIGYDEVISAINTIVPVTLHNFVDSVVSELYTKSAGSVISLSAVTALWPASRGVAAVARGVHRVYRTPEQNGFVRGIISSVIQTVIFVGMLLLSLVVLVFGSSIVRLISGKYSALAGVFDGLQKMSGIVILMVFCVFFAFVYRSFSGLHGRFRNQFAGAAFSTIGWIVFSSIFSLYIENYSNYSYVYGSLAAIVLMMLWLYACMIIFLLGAELNVIIADLRGGGERT